MVASRAGTPSATLKLFITCILLLRDDDVAFGCECSHENGTLAAVCFQELIRSDYPG
jgi:hypothetical protein